jgi:hypothetical protein
MMKLLMAGQLNMCTESEKLQANCTVDIESYVQEEITRLKESLQVC